MTSPITVRRIRFFSKPSVIGNLLTIIRESNIEHALEALAIELQPRAKDKGYLSTWKSYQTEENGEGEDKLIAAHASRRPHRSPQGLIRIFDELIEMACINIAERPDTEGYSCIADLHTELQLDSEEKIKNLARHIIEYISKLPDPQQDRIFKRMTQTEINEKIGKSWTKCKEQGTNYEQVSTKISAWAAKIIRNQG